MALSGCRHGELARRLLAGDREGACAVAEGYARLFGQSGDAAGAGAARGVVAAGFVLELSHHLLPGDDWLVAETARLAGELGLPVVVTNDVRYARPEDRELHDVLTAIRHGRSVETLAELRTPSGEHYLKSGPELAALPPGDSDAGSGHGGRLARGDRERGRAGGGLPGRPRLRAVPLPRLPGAGGRDGLLVPRRALPRRHPAALSPRDAAGREAARPRARRHRADRPRRVLPHLLGPHALREGAPDPRPGPRQRRRLDRGLRARDHPGRPHPPQPPLRALHQRGPHDLPGRRHRLQLGAARGGDPVRLRALRRRAHGDGLQPRDLPGPECGPRGRDRPGVPAPARGSRGEGARDLRLGDGPPRPRDGRRLRRVLPAPRRGAGGRRVAPRGAGGAAGSSTGWAGSTTPGGGLISAGGAARGRQWSTDVAPRTRTAPRCPAAPTPGGPGGRDITPSIKGQRSGGIRRRSGTWTAPGRPGPRSPRACSCCVTLRRGHLGR